MSLTRLHTLAERMQWDTGTDPTTHDRYTAARLDEASYLAQALHRELQAVPK
ncbi:hypothetical protein [Hymenobacter daeguensis]